MSTAGTPTSEWRCGQVKSGLEQEGLTGLDREVLGGGQQLELVTVQRRERFRGRDIFLPLVLHKDGDDWIELDYQRHILPDIEWAAVSAPDHQGAFPDPPSCNRQPLTLAMHHPFSMPTKS